MSIFPAKGPKRIVEFSRLLNERRQLLIVFGDNAADNIRLSGIVNIWQDAFREILLYYPQEQVSFFRNLPSSSTTQFYSLSSLKKIADDSICFFFRHGNIPHNLYRTSAIVICREHASNLDFLPQVSAPRDFLFRFAELTGLPFREVIPQPIISEHERTALRGKLRPGCRNHILIHLQKRHLTRNLNRVCDFLKQKLDACVYLVSDRKWSSLTSDIVRLKSNELLTEWSLMSQMNLVICDTVEPRQVASLFWRHCVGWSDVLSHISATDTKSYVQSLKRIHHHPEEGS